MHHYELNPAPEIGTILGLSSLELSSKHVMWLLLVSVAFYAGQVEAVKKLLVSKRGLLQEYFAIDISEDARLRALPIIIAGHNPVLGYMPSFLVNLATQVMESFCLYRPFTRLIIRLTG